MHLRMIATWSGFFCMHASKEKADVAGLVSEAVPTARQEMAA